MHYIRAKFRKPSSNDSLDIIVKPKIYRFHAADNLLLRNPEKKKKILKPLHTFPIPITVQYFRTLRVVA